MAQILFIRKGRNDTVIDVWAIRLASRVEPLGVAISRGPTTIEPQRTGFSPCSGSFTLSSPVHTVDQLHELVDRLDLAS